MVSAAGNRPLIEQFVENLLRKRFSSPNTVELRGENDNFDFAALAMYRGARAQRVAAHFAFDAARAAVASAGDHPLFEQFVENLLVKRFSSPRGE